MCSLGAEVVGTIVVATCISRMYRPSCLVLVSSLALLT